MPPLHTTATLTLDGSLAQDGCRITLVVQQPDSISETRGSLPPHPALCQTLEQWRQSYQSIQNTTRITPKEILYQGAVQSAANCRQTRDRLQSELNDWLASPAFRPIDRLLRESLIPHHPFKLIIRAEDWNIYRLPWHQWDFIDRHPQVSIAFSSLTPQSILPTIDREKTAHRVQILAIFGSQDGLDLSVDREILNRLPDADITQLIEPTRSQLNDALWDSAWDIICFSGHSHTQDQVGHLSINAQDQLTLDQLRYGLRQALDKGLKLALFNSCDGLGLAPELLALNLSQFIIMGEPVPDLVAHHFLDFFLTAYASGQGLSQSHRIARERLQGIEQDYPSASWLPILFENPTTPAPTWESLRGIPSPSSPPTPQTPVPNSRSTSSRPTSSRPTSSRSISLSPPSSWADVMILGLLGGTLALGLRGLGLLESLELRAFDQAIAMRPSESPDDRLLLITIDDEDIRYQEQQGMQLRDSLAPEALQTLVSKLQPLAPISLGLDIYRSQPLQLTQPTQFPLFGICKVPAPEGGDPYGVDPPPDINTPFIGFSDFVVDPDERLRRQLLAIKNEATTSQCAAQNALGFLLATHYLQAQGYTYQLNPQKSLDWGDRVWARLTPNAGGYHRLDSAGYQMLLNYRAVKTPDAIATTIPLRQILRDQVPPAVLSKLKGRIIILGNIASSSSDRWKTPIYRQTPGIYLQAQMVSQLISAVEDKRSLLRWWPEWLETLWVLSWSLGTILVYRLTQNNLFALGLGGLLLTLLCYVGLSQALWLPWIPALVGIIAIGLWLAIAPWKQRQGRSSQ